MISPAFSSFSWEQHTIPIQNRNRIVLFTDGIIETESESGMYGLERLVEQVTDNSVQGSVLSEQIVQGVHQFAAGRPIHDDLTLLVADL
jgi:serine phosphatase RsbU (regulator of sigma subunit)